MDVGGVRLVRLALLAHVYVHVHVLHFVTILYLYSAPINAIPDGHTLLLHGCKLEFYTYMYFWEKKKRKSRSHPCAQHPYTIVHFPVQLVYRMPMDDVVILDVDESTIESPHFDDLLSLPPDVVSNLKHILKKQSSAYGDTVTRYMCSKDYEKSTVPCTTTVYV